MGFRVTVAVNGSETLNKNCTNY